MEIDNKTTNFIRKIIADDIVANKNNSQVHTRFPPEPNGYLHLGHAKSICLNFGVAKDFNGLCNLRFDDTNPEKEDVEYTDSIQEDVRWLGFDWEERIFYASDYFQQLYELAVHLIKNEKAYVDSLTADEIREYRGTLTKAGKDSPYRNQSIEENLDLFQRMKDGEFDEGEKILRARIDMSSPNINLRDPAIYRIRKASHHRTGNEWNIYPMYDFTHCISDALENITHSLCTLEFEDHRPLYDWFLDQLPVPCHPQQIEFARLNLSYMVLSKRKLNQLVQEGLVDGWDDPRMPTISGIRRRGYPATAIRDFCERIGVTKNDTVIDLGVLENSVREQLDQQSPRVMGVLNPLKIVIENYPDDKTEYIEAANHPHDEMMGKRTIPFSKVIYIDRDDFREQANKKYFRLKPDKEVRLRYAYVIRCDEVIKNDAGEVVELRCSYDPESGGGKTSDGRKVKGIIHWVAEDTAIKATVRLYDRLFSVEAPEADADSDWKSFVNPESVEIIENALIEPSIVDSNNNDFTGCFQFERTGYFCVDKKDSTDEQLVFNRTITLRDSWAKKT